ncbi:unnamed protein product [Amoebophrya sp. A120]|nr:unnamed protein product [Amoebophrya sp. A120]|eukprot:GSA120T00022719001.1
MICRSHRRVSRRISKILPLISSSKATSALCTGDVLLPCGRQKENICFVYFLLYLNFIEFTLESMALPSHESVLSDSCTRESVFRSSCARHRFILIWDNLFPL